MKVSIVKAVLTDIQFWVPAAMLVSGILLLAYVR